MRDDIHSLDSPLAGFLCFVGDIDALGGSPAAQPRKQGQFYPPLYVFAPVDEIPHLFAVMARTGISCQYNLYEVPDWKGLEVCHFKRSQLNAFQQSAIREAEQQGAQVHSLQACLEQRLNWVEIDILDAEYLLDIEVSSNRSSTGYRRVRRAFDIVLSSLLLALAAPFGLLVALVIKLDSPGPVFFRQSRTGLFNKEFEIIKFRSMRQDAEKSGARWAAKNDCRVTRVGRFIRNMRIDELPQLINVLKGEMSLIGPRPEREVFIGDLEKHIPFYRFRHMVKPGITGFAQVMYSYGASLEDARQKHRYDLYYIKHRSFRLDLRIMRKTAWIVLTGQGV